MPTGKPSKKPASNALGVKMLISAASLAATLGGWAFISAKETKPAPLPTADQTSDFTVTIKFAPLPTLVPPITPQSQPIAVNQSQSSPARPSASAPPATANEIVLRDVSAPALSDRSASVAPAPVANTRSSR